MCRSMVMLLNIYTAMKSHSASSNYALVGAILYTLTTCHFTSFRDLLSLLWLLTRKDKTVLVFSLRQFVGSVSTPHSKETLINTGSFVLYHYKTKLRTISKQLL